MLRDKFNRTCTNYYTYSNTYYCVNESCHVTNSGCRNHTNSGYGDHYDSGYDNHHDTGCNNTSHTESIYSDGCPQADTCNHNYSGYNNHYDSGYDDHYDSGYGDHSESGYNNHNDYINYNNGYSCSTYANYVNYVDASNTKLGASYTPSWSNIIPSSNSEINSSFIKELRDKLRQLSTSKQRNQVNDSNIQSGSGTSSDSNLSQFNKIDNLSIENIRTTLNNIYSELNQAVPNIGSIGDSDTYMKTDVFINIKNAIDNLAKTDISSSYVNYVNSSYDYNNQNTYANSSNIPKEDITYTNTGILSYVNTYYSEYKNS